MPPTLPPQSRLTQHLEALKQQAAATLDKVIPTNQPCALLDFPNYSNVGDSAIWMGQMAYCRTAAKPIRYAASMHSYAEGVLRRAMPRGVVLIQGGGNFGSLWKHHQNHRNQLLRTLRDYTLVQLPQSLYFGDDTACFEETAALIRQHPDFTLLVRDKASEAIGNQLGARTVLCPDSAIFLHGKLQRKPPSLDCFALKRTDKESTDSVWPPVPGGQTAMADDWLEEPGHWLDSSLFALQRRAHGRFGHQWAYQRLLLAAFNARASYRVLRGVKQLSQGRVVVTDRLHAHLLATLLHIPNVVLDNQDNKIHGYMSCWDNDFNQQCTNANDVWLRATQLLNKQTGKTE